MSCIILWQYKAPVLPHNASDPYNPCSAPSLMTSSRNNYNTGNNIALPTLSCL